MLGVEPPTSGLSGQNLKSQKPEPPWQVRLKSVKSLYSTKHVQSFAIWQSTVNSANLEKGRTRIS